MYHCCQLYPIFCGQLLRKFRHRLQKKQPAVEKFVKFSPKLYIFMSFSKSFKNIYKKLVQKIQYEKKTA